MPDTIAAIATGGGLSAIGIVRLSGADAIAVADKVFTPDSGKAMSEYESRRLVHGKLRGADGEIIDACLCTLSRAPNSYTGEDTAELQCHGSPVVLRLALEALFSSGARQALPGEFTKRAFLNGRMDLAQAEAVIDLIGAETAAAAKNAAGQLGGAVSRKIDDIYSSVIDMSSHFHAVLDYPDEDIAPFELCSYLARLEAAERELAKLLSSFERGRIMKDGLRAVILGRPNVGKSSLLNSLLGYERAIVTPLPGTTRDTIEERVTLGGVLLRLTDTAGLREAADPVEKLGVDRARDAAGQAELAIAVFDGSEPLGAEDMDALAAAKLAGRSIAVINKNDLKQVLSPSMLDADFDAVCSVSAAQGEGLAALEEAVRDLFPSETDAPVGEILTNARQADAVSRALESVRAALHALDTGLTPDIVLTETEQALSALGELTGKNLREEVTARIFERFCVGK